MTKPLIRRYANLPGSPPSVTSILGAIWPKPALQQWFVTTTAELAREYPDCPVADLLKLHGPRGDVRGTSVHKLIAAWLNGLTDAPAVTDETEAMFLQWLRWWEPQGITGAQPEVVLRSDEMRDGLDYAGTADAIVPGSMIWDWKTASTIPSEPYSEHVAQVAAYAACMSWPSTIEAHVVYIGLKAVKPFRIKPSDLIAKYDAFCYAYRLAEHLYPDEMRAVPA